MFSGAQLQEMARWVLHHRGELHIEVRIIALAGRLRMSHAETWARIQRLAHGG